MENEKWNMNIHFPFSMKNLNIGIHPVNTGCRYSGFYFSLKLNVHNSILHFIFSMKNKINGMYTDPTRRLAKQ